MREPPTKYQSEILKKMEFGKEYLPCSIVMYEKLGFYHEVYHARISSMYSLVKKGYLKKVHEEFNASWSPRSRIWFEKVRDETEDPSFEQTDEMSPSEKYVRNLQKKGIDLMYILDSKPYQVHYARGDKYYYVDVMGLLNAYIASKKKDVLGKYIKEF